MHLKTLRPLILQLILAVLFTRDLAVAAPGENASVLKTNLPTFEVKGYEVIGNTILPKERIDLVWTKYTGKNVDMEQVHSALADLQLEYRRLGFVTVGVTLPKQRLTNGIVRIQVTEGRLANISVVGNRYYSSNNIRRAVPGLATNILLNTKWLQPELDAANANSDRQIYPKVIPGPDPGTTALVLQVKDRLPLHAHFEINDKSTPGTPLLRMDSAVQYNDLWQLNHQLGLEYNFSLPDMKPSGSHEQFFDQPAVASYSAFYRIPFDSSYSRRELYEQMPVTFGYDQVTHRFNLPPLTGSPELVIYGSRSDTDTGSQLGPVTPIGTNTSTLTVNGQSTERDPSTTGDIGTRFILPLPQWEGIQSSLSAGFDLKTYRIQTLATNFTTVTMYTTDSPPVLIGSPIVVPVVSPYTDNQVYYLPLSAGWSGSRSDSHGTTSFGINGSLFLSSLSSSSERVRTVAGSPEAGGNYGTVNLNLSREQKLPAGFIAQLRANGQWASEPLISNEQFGLGGTGGVRGYREGEVYGDNGWRALFDLRAPALGVGSFPTSKQAIPANLRCSWFMDYGEAYYIDPNEGQTIREWGTGLGFYYTAGSHFDARLTVAWALHDAVFSRAGEAQAYFSVGIQF